VGISPTIPGYPKNYKIDIAHPVLMIGIEVDGKSHLAKKKKQEDAQKTAYLEARGWKILRFQNKEILSSLEVVTCQIMKVVKSST
jgi:very-short-patch-repair endonuclease